MGEWRHIDMFQPGSPAFLPNLTAPDALTVDEGGSIPVAAAAAPPLARPWIQFFNHTGFGGRFVVVDHADAPKDDFHDFSLLDRGHPLDWTRFTDRASSWRWFAPRPCAIRANEHATGDPDFPGPSNPDLVWNRGTAGRRRSARRGAGRGSRRHVRDGVVGAVWCGVFELLRGGARRFAGTWISTAPRRRPATTSRCPRSISTARRTSRSPSTRVILPTAWMTTKDIAVEVRNVSPVVGSWTLLDPTGRRIGVDVPFALIDRPVRGLATFTDAGPARPAQPRSGVGRRVDHTVVHQVRRFGRRPVGQLEAQRAYTVPGTYSAGVMVSDYEEGIGAATAALKVVSPADALKEAIALLDALIASTSEPARNYLLARAPGADRSGLAGTASGAQTKIDRELVKPPRLACDWPRVNSTVRRRWSISRSSRRSSTRWRRRLPGSNGLPGWLPAKFLHRRARRSGGLFFTNPGSSCSTAKNGPAKR